MLLTRLLTTVVRPSVRVVQRYASTSISTTTTHGLDKAVFMTPSTHTVSVASVSDYVSRLRPFTVPAPPQPTMTTPPKATETLELTSVLRKRRLKMNKHKHKKLRKRTRALRKKLGK